MKRAPVVERKLDLLGRATNFFLQTFWSMYQKLAYSVRYFGNRRKQQKSRTRMFKIFNIIMIICKKTSINKSSHELPFHSQTFVQKRLPKIFLIDESVVQRKLSGPPLFPQTDITLSLKILAAQFAQIPFAAEVSLCL